MGSYNSQYESYYAKILQKRNAGPYSSYSTNNKESNPIIPKLDINYLYKRLIRDFIGVLCLLFMVISCKLITTPQTLAVYKYSKEVVSYNIDYKIIYSKIVNINLEDIKDKIEDWIDGIKVKITGDKAFKDKIKEDYLVPLKGSITSGFGKREDPFTKQMSMHEGVDIDAKENTEIKSPYKGKVREVGEDTIFGKFILISHGDGIETKYAHLNEISVKKDEEVEKAQVIAKSGNTGRSTAPHLHFEFIYMGQNKNPLEYLNFN